MRIERAVLPCRIMEGPLPSLDVAHGDSIPLVPASSHTSVLNILFILFVLLQDPSVTQVRPSVPPPLEEYNPFTDARTVG